MGGGGHSMHIPFLLQTGNRAGGCQWCSFAVNFGSRPNTRICRSQAGHDLCHVAPASSSADASAASASCPAQAAGSSQTASCASMQAHWQCLWWGEGVVEHEVSEAAVGHSGPGCWRTLGMQKSENDHMRWQEARANSTPWLSLVKPGQGGVGSWQPPWRAHSLSQCGGVDEHLRRRCAAEHAVEGAVHGQRRQAGASWQLHLKLAAHCAGPGGHLEPVQAGRHAGGQRRQRHLLQRALEAHWEAPGWRACNTLRLKHVCNQRPGPWAL